MTEKYGTAPYGVVPCFQRSCRGLLVDAHRTAGLELDGQFARAARVGQRVVVEVRTAHERLHQRRVDFGAAALDVAAAEKDNAEVVGGSAVVELEAALHDTGVAREGELHGLRILLAGRKGHGRIGNRHVLHVDIVGAENGWTEVILGGVYGYINSNYVARGYYNTTSPSSFIGSSGSTTVVVVPSGDEHAHNGAVVSTPTETNFLGILPD